jgi:TPR repeat protein
VAIFPIEIPDPRPDLDRMAATIGLAAERRHPQALCALGHLRLLGMGLDADEERAVSDYGLAAELGNVEARHALSMLAVTGRVPHRAARWGIPRLIEASMAGFPPAWYHVGQMFLAGERVPRSRLHGGDLLRRAFEVGFEPGRPYPRLESDPGPANPVDSLRWGRLAAHRWFRRGLEVPDRLGTMEAAMEAARHLAKAARFGFGPALYQLGLIHRHGPVEAAGGVSTAPLFRLALDSDGAEVLDRPSLRHSILEIMEDALAAFRLLEPGPPASGGSRPGGDRPGWAPPVRSPLAPDGLPPDGLPKDPAPMKPRGELKEDFEEDLAYASNLVSRLLRPLAGARPDGPAGPPDFLELLGFLGRRSGFGVPTSVWPADLFELLATSGRRAVAWFLLAKTGWRGERLRARHAGEIGRWLASACLGFPPAQHAMAMITLRGEGAAADPDLAARWIELAAMGDYTPAIYAMGVLRLGGLGVAADRAEAMRLLGAAASRGHLPAQIRLRSMVALA